MTVPATNTSPRLRHAINPTTPATAANAVRLEGNELLGGWGYSGVKCIATNGRATYVSLPISWLAHCASASPASAATPGRSLRVPNAIARNATGHAKMNAAVDTITIGVNHACAIAKACSACDGPWSRAGITFDEAP